MLREMGITSLEDMRRLSRAALLRHHGCNRKTAKEIREAFYGATGTYLPESTADANALREAEAEIAALKRQIASLRTLLANKERREYERLRKKFEGNP